MDVRIKYVKERIGKITDFKSQGFLYSPIFGEYILNLYNSPNKEELQRNLFIIATEVKKNTTLDYNYDIPMLWDNWGLKSSRYSGSGGGVGSKSGYGSDTKFTSSRLDIFSLLENLLFIISLLKKNEQKEGVPEIWKHLIEDTVKERDNEKYITEILGEIWLQLMNPEDLKKLQIRFSSGLMFETRAAEEKSSMPLGTIVSENLLPLALSLAADHNKTELNPEHKIYFEEIGEYGYIRLISPKNDILTSARSIATSPSTAKLEERLDRHDIAELNLKELVQILESLNPPLPKNKEARKVFMGRAFQEKLLEQREA